MGLISGPIRLSGPVCLISVIVNAIVTLAENDVRKLLYVSVALVMIGAMLVVLDNILLLNRGATSKSIVVRLVERDHYEDGETWFTYNPVLRFITTDGEIHEFLEEDMDVDAGELEPGDTVQVYYWPEDPEHAVAHTAGLWLVPMVAVPAAIFAWLLVTLLFSGPKPKKKARRKSPRKTAPSANEHS